MHSTRWRVQPRNNLIGWYILYSSSGDISVQLYTIATCSIGTSLAPSPTLIVTTSGLAARTISTTRLFWRGLTLAHTTLAHSPQRYTKSFSSPYWHTPWYYFGENKRVNRTKDAGKSSQPT